MRTKSLNALREDYEGVCNALEELPDEPGTTEAKAASFHSKLLTFEIYFAISISHKVFFITEQLATYLQDKQMTLTQAVESANDIVTTLKTVRTRGTICKDMAKH